MSNKRQRGRPRTLPPFNSQVPRAFLVGGPLEIYRIEAHDAVRATLDNSPNAGLLWLALYRRVRCAVLRTYTKSVLNRETTTISEQEHIALLWTKHKGKHNP